MKFGRVVEAIKPRLKLVKFNRELAQLVERHPYKVDVAGSNPVLPTKKSRRERLFSRQIPVASHRCLLLQTSVMYGLYTPSFSVVTPRSARVSL